MLEQLDLSYFKTSYPGRVDWEVYRYLIYNIINNSFQFTDKYSRKALIGIWFRLSQNLEFFSWSLAGIFKHWLSYQTNIFSFAPKLTEF